MHSCSEEDEEIDADGDKVVGVCDVDVEVAAGLSPECDECTMCAIKLMVIANK